MNHSFLRFVVSLVLFITALLPFAMPRIAAAADPFIGAWTVAPASGTQWESGGTITVSGASKEEVSKLVPANGANDQSQIQCLGFAPSEDGYALWPAPQPLSWYTVTFSWRGPTMGGCTNRKNPNSVALFGLPRGVLATLSTLPDGSLSGCWKAGAAAGCAAFRASVSQAGETAQNSGPAVTISGLSRKVEIQRNDASWEPATDATKLKPGDKIHTGYKSGAVITFPDGSTLTLQPMTLVLIDTVEVGQKPRVIIWLKLGEVSAGINRTKGVVQDFDVKTLTLTASVRGTKFTVNYDEKKTIVSVTEGTVHVQPTNTALAAFDLSAGSEASVSKDSATAPGSIGSQKKSSNNMVLLLAVAALAIVAIGGYLFMRRRA